MLFRSLKSKITSVFIVLVFLTLIVGCFSVGIIGTVRVSINNIMTANYRSIQLCQSILATLSDQNQLVFTYAVTGGEGNVGRFYSGTESFLQNIVEEEHNISQPGEQALVDSVKGGYAKYEDMFAQLQAVRKSQGGAAALSYYEKNGASVYRRLQQDTVSISGLNQTGLEKSEAVTSRQAARSMTLLAVMTLLTAAGGFILSRFFAGRLLHPLQELTGKISEMKAGMWDRKLAIDTNDEVGKLAREFNNMTGRLTLFEQSTKGSLLREKMQSAAILRSISDPLIVLDRHYRILLMNSASEDFFGISAPDSENRHFMECIRSEELYDIILNCAESKTNRAEKTVLFQKDAGPLYYHVVVVPMQDDEKTEYILWMQNVTDFKELERVKNEFIATISHELKTPLTSIVMGASMLEGSRMGALTDDQNEVLSTIAEYAGQMSELVGRMLELARIESGKAVYHMGLCRVSDILRASVGCYKKRARLQRITLSVRAEDDMPPVYGDPEKLTWVLNNLLSNALKYTAAGGSVQVEAEPAGLFAQISVTDNGEGIPPAFLGRVFDEFVQVPVRDVEIRGSGFGLYAAKKIVEEHHGRISVTSTQGKGSRFTFTVPFNWEGIN